MKTLTLTQPWATLVMLGEKCIETRPVLFKHRGQLWIHASREIDEDACVQNAAIALTLHKAGIDWPSLPTGKVLGSVDVVDGCRFEDRPFPSCLPFFWREHLARYEGEFGDYRTGRGGLLLRNPKLLDPPIPARGMNGLWNWEP